MEIIKNWVLSIVITVIILVIVDMLGPAEKSKKYIKLLSGLILILVILKPFIMITNSQQDIYDYINSKVNNVIETDESNTKDYDTISYDDKVIEIYKMKIEKDIRELLVNEYTVSINRIVIELDQNKDSQDYCNISKIDVYIKNTKNNQEINIPKIKIDKKEYKETNSENVTKMKQKVADMLLINSEKINIFNV